MEQAAIDAFTPAFRRALFARLGITTYTDLGGFESHVFLLPDASAILRVTHVSHRSIDDIQAELEFLAHLAAGGARVASPLPLPSGALCEQVDDFIVCLFRQAKGRLIGEQDWSAPLFSAWGRAIGQFHRLAVDFAPSTRRIGWQSDPNFALAERIPADQSLLRQMGDSLVNELSALDTGPENFGLIHSDAHAGNFFSDDGTLTFFDFDDTCYCWYVYDIATVLFSAVLQPWMGDSQAEREAVAAAFIGPFLDGYNQEFELTPFASASLPLFLKVREFSLYGVINTFFDVDNLTEWYPRKFMQGRRARMEAGAPYLDLDFSAY